MSQQGMENAAKGMSTGDIGHQLKELNNKSNRSDSEELKRKILEKEWDRRPLHERIATGLKEVLGR